MKTKNFRVGNYIIQPGRIGQISEIWQKAIRIEGYNNGYDYKHTYPIPISDDLLINFGFDLIINKDGDTLYHLNEITYSSKSGWWWKHHLKVQPKYIHELQNLFFILENEELKLKDDTILFKYLETYVYS